MTASFTVAREFASALGDLVLSVPRHAVAFARRGKARAEFQALELDPVPADAADEPPPKQLRRIFLSCGDASGESHALRLLDELRKRHPDLEVAGFGGERLAASGMDVWKPLADLNVMGFVDVAAQLPLFFGCVHRFTRELNAQPPDAVVLVDYPGLNRHLLRIAHRAQVPTIDFIAPQLWAWAPWRIRDFKHATRLLTILPFEGDWYRKRGAQPAYIGHPLGDTLVRDPEEAPAALDEPAPWVGILPGSRKREVRQCLPHMLAAAAVLQREHSEVRFVLPHLRNDVWPIIDEELARHDVKVLRAPGCYHSVLGKLQAAWVTSGTALLEVAAHGVPPVLVYGLKSRIADWLGRNALSVPAVGSLNLMAKHEVAPEFVGRQLDPQALAGALARRLSGAERVESLATIASLCPHFARPGAATRAARAVEQAVAPPQNG